MPSATIRQGAGAGKRISFLPANKQHHSKPPCSGGVQRGRNNTMAPITSHMTKGNWIVAPLPSQWEISLIINEGKCLLTNNPFILGVVNLISLLLPSMSCLLVCKLGTGLESYFHLWTVSCTPPQQHCLWHCNCCKPPGDIILEQKLA